MAEIPVYVIVGPLDDPITQQEIGAISLGPDSTGESAVQLVGHVLRQAGIYFLNPEFDLFNQVQRIFKDDREGS